VNTAQNAAIKWLKLKVSRQTVTRTSLSLFCEFPAARIDGRYFHFTQSLWRKAQELGLVGLYQANRKAQELDLAGLYQANRRLRKILQNVKAMGFLPLPVVGTNFRHRRTSRIV
jgi:hypothetical protein